jgi:membrane protease YdiL (CAAX protease family)
MDRLAPTPLRAFFALALGGSFFFWALAGALAPSVWEGPGPALFYLGGAAVPLAALWVTLRWGGPAALRALLRSLVDPTRIPAVAWLFLLAFVPSVSLVASVMGPDGPAPVGLLDSRGVGGALATAGFALLFGPLPEEIGWRGCALPALLVRFGPLAASTGLFLAWALWHVPLFLLPGYYAPFGGPPAPAVFFLELAANTVLQTWLFLVTGGSVLAAVLYHFAVNFTGELLPVPAAAEPLRAGLFLVGAGVAGVWCARRGFERVKSILERRYNYLFRI